MKKNAHYNYSKKPGKDLWVMLWDEFGDVFEMPPGGDPAAYLRKGFTIDPPANPTPKPDVKLWHAETGELAVIPFTDDTEVLDWEIDELVSKGYIGVPPRNARKARPKPIRDKVEQETEVVEPKPPKAKPGPKAKVAK